MCAITSHLELVCHVGCFGGFKSIIAGYDYWGLPPLGNYMIPSGKIKASP